MHADKLFHAGFAATMELPRFVRGFLGSHGAVDYVLDTRGQRRTFEKTVLGIAGGAAVASALIARERRKVAEQRRLGPKGACWTRTDPTAGGSASSSSPRCTPSSPR
ncbi:hypothetical protein GCM10018772_68820 [Streptomyces fumanus]|uniref:Uncharacterized protein n=1 Tax=Streptomyces fumanus TaxID=67302 RepID=A0A919AZK3_9ACTN|nr:hypothetical protein GCM10018772_68820 [Streptomyces fumanus]